MELGFPKKSPCACSGLAVDCPSMWSASGGQWGVLSRKCSDIEEKCRSCSEESRRTSGRSRRYFGKYGRFFKKCRRKNKGGTRTDVICLRKMEHCAAVPSYEICRCRNENFGKQKFMCKFVRISCNSQTLEFQA